MDPAIEQIAMSATPEYLAVLKSKGIVPADWVPPVAAQAPRAPIAPQVTPMQAAPIQPDPMVELRRYFGY